MRKRKKVTHFITMALIASTVTSCGSASVPKNIEVAGIQQENSAEDEKALEAENKKIITAEVEKYLSDTIFTEFDQQEVLYNKYLMFSSVNILSSLINILDEKIGKIKASFGVNAEVAKFILENFENTIEKLIYEKDGLAKLNDIVTKNCKTEILGISATENKNEYLVDIKVTNMDFFGSINSSDVIKVITENLQVGDVINSESIWGAAKKAGTTAIFSFGNKKKIFKAALEGLLKSSGKEGINEVAAILIENVGECKTTNSYTGKIKVVITDGTAYIVEKDKALIHACYSIFDEKFLDMEADSLYDAKVTEFLKIREERENVAAEEN